MATIVPNQTFKHGTETYEEGQSYEVYDEEADYFEAVGWVGDKGSRANGQVHLDIHDVVLGHSSEVN